MVDNNFRLNDRRTTVSTNWLYSKVLEYVDRSTEVISTVMRKRMSIIFDEINVLLVQIVQLDEFSVMHLRYGPLDLFH